ncbi:MAG: TetR/AcrR family transcriptional regulator [Myxococcota bacterium]
MARKKTYDRREAVERAMLAFLEKGYSNLGVREIEQRTGINRFALQTAFGGKEGLFTEALSAYLEASRAMAERNLAPGGLDAIADFFRERLEGRDDDPRNSGCLIVNTVIENAALGMDGPRERIHAFYADLEQGFRRALERGRERGEVDEALDLEGAALSLVTFAMGIGVFVRLGGHLDAARRQGEFAIGELQRWKKRSPQG